MAFRVTPLIRISLFYFIGLLLSYIFPIDIYMSLFLSSLIIGILIFSQIKFKKIIYPDIIFVLVGLLIGWYSIQSNNSNPLKRYYNRNSIIYGKIIGYQKPLRRYNKVLFKILKINNRKVLAKINLLSKKSIILRKDSSLIIRTKIKKPVGAANFGEINYGLYYNRYKIYGYAYLIRKRQILKIYPSSTLYYVTEKIREDIKNFIKKNYSKHQSTFLNAILLSDRTQLNKKIKNIFINTGTIHILAISGLHIGIITLIFLSLFQLFFKNKKVSYFLTLIIIILYNFIIGYRISIIRATIMFSIMILTRLLDRDKNYLNALAFAALIILLFNPSAISTISFQLSFLATLGVILFTTDISNFITKKIKIRNKSVIYVIDIISASIAAQILIIPVLLYYFHKFAYISIIANLIAIPMITIILFLSILAYLFFHILPIVSTILSSLNNLLIALMIYLLNILTVIKPIYIYIIRPIPIFLYYLFISTIFIPIKNIKYKIILSFLPLIFIFITISPSSTNISHSNRTEIIIFNIKGRSIFIKTENNYSILIDGGYYSDATHHIIPFLRRNKINKIDKLILTDDAKYRSEGLVNILKKIKVKKYYDTGYPSSSLRYQRIMEIISSKQIPYYIVRARNSINIDNIKIKVLSPLKNLFKNYNSKREMYENSLCLKIIYEKFSFLLTSDILSRQINILASKYAKELNTSCLNLSSLNFSNIEKLLTYADPEITFINKTFNHFERNKLLNLKKILNKFNTEYIFTQEKGAIKIIIYPDGKYKYITSY